VAVLGGRQRRGVGADTLGDFLVKERTVRELSLKAIEKAAYYGAIIIGTTLLTVTLALGGVALGYFGAALIHEFGQWVLP
jgi:hypothetical protein